MDTRLLRSCKKIHAEPDEKKRAEAIHHLMLNQELNKYSSENVRRVGPQNVAIGTPQDAESVVGDASFDFDYTLDAIFEASKNFRNGLGLTSALTLQEVNNQSSTIRKSIDDFRNSGLIDPPAVAMGELFFEYTLGVQAVAQYTIKQLDNIPRIAEAVRNPTSENMEVIFGELEGRIEKIGKYFAAQKA